MALDESKNEEELHTINEIEVLISEEILPHTADNQLDYINDARGQGFTLGKAHGSSCC